MTNYGTMLVFEVLLSLRQYYGVAFIISLSVAFIINFMATVATYVDNLFFQKVLL